MYLKISIQKAFIFIFILSFSDFFGQTINGLVTDTLRKPLPYTNIIAKPLSDNIEMVFAITDEKGRYKLVLQAKENYKVTVSYLGFQQVSFEVKLTENIIKNIPLKPSTNKLDEVIIIQEVPVRVKEDTITYNTDAFTTGTERKLKQVLKKLPGVEVDRNGGVTVMGKKVNKLLVDNKPFFGGGTKLGVENIPADAVDGVEVIDNYTEVIMLKGLSDSDQMAMNIKLKKDKKRFTFGDIETGAGTDKHYLVHPNIFYYSPKTNVNFIGDINDIGVKSFTIKDYLEFEGGIGKMLSDPSSYFQLSNNAFSGFLGNQDFKSGINKFGAVNISQEINNNWDVSGYSIYSNTQNETQVETENRYLSQNEETLESKIVNGSTDNSFFLGKLSLDYAPGDNDDVSYSGFFKSSNNSDFDGISSISPTITTNLNSTTEDNTITVKQNAEWHKKLSRKHTTSLTVNYQYDKSNPNTNWLTNQPILQGLIPLQNDNEYNINQIKSLKLHNLNVLFKHYWVLNRSNHIYTTLGNNTLDEKYITDEYQVLTNGSINNFNTADFGNDLNYRINDFYLAMQHKFKVGIVEVKYGASAHNYNWKANQATQTHKNKWVVLPDFLTNVEINSSEKLRFNYNLKSRFSDAPKFANKFQLLGYNAVTRGNEQLENEIYHSARLLYTKFSMYRGIAMSGSASYNKKVKSIRSQVQLQGIDRFSMPFLTDNPETRWMFRGNIRKTFGKIITKVNGNLTLSDYFQEVNGTLSKNKSNSTGFGLELATNFKEWPNIEVGFKKNYSNFSSENLSSKFTNENPYINFEYDFLNGFILMADYSSNTYRDNNNQKNNYEIANASLFYQKEDSAWGFKVSGTNILGANFKNENSFSEYIISDQRTYILPRIWMFSITYKL
ncbi:carboxypeptidase-like regulatory domain-containing protein [Aureibaculum sp. A20]|uniref:Carboxypeptidase-like regulatory domain-containing protein n=1 Tax=Aureibaculum flavum TaxID=2795986 RepID=A0ABS0WW04_9FLAO|nr:carboxypeptidase-like regulatory domain-containing protein [Aureibaculum flavum]MBJ2176174.1 carboxypeptidase-like regulatory domain-containing protein [Aureibaculum flavum]